MAISTASAMATTESATEFTLIYSYPLLPYTQFALPAVSNEQGTNRLKHNRQPATPDDQSVVRPNVDTLYSQAVLDLSGHDLVIEVPPITDRYWVFPFYDAYGDNYANLGSINQSPPGKYLVHYENDTARKPGLYSCGEHSASGNDNCDGYQGIITSPTPYGGFVGRILLKNGERDLQKVHAIQNQTALYRIARKGPHGPRLAPKLTMEMLNGSLSRDIPTRIMQLCARFAPFSPPRNISDKQHVDRMLQMAGIHNGQYHPTVTNLTAVAQKARENVRAIATKPGNLINLKNNWYGLSPSGQGDYDTNYGMRAYVAKNGYLALVATEALYPSYQKGSSLTLGPNEAYTITFNSKPPLADGGFWSITIYNVQQYLVSNDLNRYALGDRSGLIYDDGSLVYANDAKNETFRILVQPSDVSPPSNQIANWLPAPAKGGEFSITLRFYGPTNVLADGHWPYPVVEKHGAIRAETEKV
ncbi:hypothetical protein BDV23DRAFT_143930 [Aspergillus alliaceus]|uniref:DUF1254-domain-containing protein n=1 Tax=Petromyces alliaceus TaxID=209559 RepID=A0A5N7CQB4_PETAA|nr:hypothetical protein BDV23DRAFT_143930 [Aspergillus alliaceus]